MKLTDVKDTKQALADRFRRLYRKHGIDGILRHLPIIAEMLIEGVGFNAPSATKAIIRLIDAFGNGGANDGRDEMAEPLNNRFVSILATQKQLADRYNMLEEENAKIRGEVASCTNQLTLFKAEMKTAKAEVESVQKRNAYLGWGLLVVGLLALSEVAWIFIH